MGCSCLLMALRWNKLRISLSRELKFEGRTSIGFAPFSFVLFSLRQGLVLARIIGDVVEALPFTREQGNASASKVAWIVKGAYLHNLFANTRPLRARMSSTLRTKESRYGMLNVRATELSGSPLYVRKALLRHEEEVVWTTAGNVLALSAVTLCLEHGLSRRDVTQCAAITSTFKLLHATTIDQIQRIAECRF